MIVYALMALMPVMSIALIWAILWVCRTDTWESRWAMAEWRSGVLGRPAPIGYCVVHHTVVRRMPTKKERDCFSILRSHMPCVIVKPEQLEPTTAVRP